MRTLVLVAVVAGAGAVSCACRRSAAGPGGTAGAAVPSTELQGTGSRTTVPREYLVTLAGGSGEAPIREVYGRYGIARIQDLGRNVFLVTLSEDPGLEKMKELGLQDARIEAVQPNFVYTGS